MPSHSASPDGLPRPRVIGRLVRLLLGIFLLFVFVNLVRAISAQGQGFLTAEHGWQVPGGDWWLAALVCLWALPRLINSGFSRNWGGWPRVGFLVLAAGTVAWDWLGYGRFWATPLAILVVILVGYVMVHAGVSFLVAGAAATPG